ncbi:MAG: nucleotidyltransferase [bacterium]
MAADFYSQLSRRGDITKSKQTADTIKYILSIYPWWPKNMDYKVFLQGSYKNNTNIGSSDVDVVIAFDIEKSCYKKYDLYLWNNLRKRTINALWHYFGGNKVIEGNKSLKILDYCQVIDIDVVVSFIF